MKRAAMGGICLAVALLGGCEKKTTVSGAVTYNGKPVEEGYVTFSPRGKGRSFAAPVAKGKYAVAEAFPGQYTAIASGTRKINHYKSSAEANANAKKAGSGHTSEAADYIAQEAPGNNQNITVEAGEQQLNFTITGPPGP